MASIDITIDTESQTISAKVNGKEVPNITEANVYRLVNSKGSVDMFGVNLVQREDMEDMRKVTHIMASESKEAQEAVAEGTAQASELGEDFIEVRSDLSAKELRDEISDFFDGKI